MNDNEKLKPNYYSVLPANVRYDKKLSYFEKVLYSEIVALSNVYGYTFASNNYFADLYEMSLKNISRSLSNIQNQGHITMEIDVSLGNKRKIFITTPIDKKVYTPIDKKVHTPIDKIVQTPIDKIVPGKDSFNTTSKNTNTTSNNNQRYYPSGSNFSKTKRQTKTVDIEIPWLDSYLASIE